MSRSISIFYRDEATGRDTDIEVGGNWELLGCQQPSMDFWSLPRIREIGIVRLAELGVTDPVMFFGWDDLTLLRREITLLDANLASIDFPLEAKASWLCNLIYCYHALAETAPKESTPMFIIG
jgi:hypothetical protein